MKSIANLSSFGARAIAGTSLLAARPIVVSFDGRSAKWRHKHR
jgi:hypothetical protein